MKFPQGPGNRETEVLLPGERSTAEGRAVGNRILLALPEAEYQTLRPLLSSVVLSTNLATRLSLCTFPTLAWCPW